MEHVKIQADHTRVRVTKVISDHTVNMKLMNVHQTRVKIMPPVRTLLDLINAIVHKGIQVKFVKMIKTNAIIRAFHVTLTVYVLIRLAHITVDA